MAATYDGTTLRLYVNGVLTSERTAGGPIRTDNGVLRIGGNSLWGEYFNGLIDEVRIYNRALNAVQIQTDMSTPL
ncbi:LamG domain-containing protein [Nonomuraea rubra]|uniref:LamG domain-containing protein n=1 Tax=Nonomuraea rubra TaxID=46180 RepID=UPI0036087AF2